jgi:dTDP-glucose 4,6-dehydratase
MKNVLVTGGSGFIGFNFINCLLEQYPDVRAINLDKLTYAGNPDGLRDIRYPWRYIFIPGDICSPRVFNILKEFQIDTIVNFAAETHIDKSIDSPYEFVKTNIFGTYNLLECAKKWGKLERFHHISTDEVFGTLEGMEDLAFSETTCYAPNTPYASTKASSDLLCRSYFKTYGMPITISNCSNNYGMYQFPEKLIPMTIYNAVKGNPILVHGDGDHVRDWLYVDDHCDGILRILEAGQVGQTYNLGGESPRTTIEVVETVSRILDKVYQPTEDNKFMTLVKFVNDRPGNDLCYMMDISYIRQELGWSPEHKFEEGIRETVMWYINNWQWLENAINRPEHVNWIKKHNL